MAYSLRKIQMVITTLVIMAIGTVQGRDGSSTSSAGCGEACAPKCCCPDSCGQFFANAQLLYLRAFEGGLSSVCDSTHITDSTEDGILTSRLKSKNHDPDFKWNLGFRVGAGYEFADSNCDIGAYWTHFDSHTGNENHKNGHKWKINFNVVDVLYRCDCGCSSCFVLTPFGGLRYASIDQKLRTNFLSTMDTSFIVSKGNSKEDFLGIGPLFGIDGDWDVGCGFSLYGNISAAVLYGRFHGRSNQTDQFNTGININHLRKHIEACQAVVDSGFGVRWKTCFCEDKLLVLQLGVEQHRYFNHNQFCGYGDLSLDGASLAINITF